MTTNKTIRLTRQDEPDLVIENATLVAEVTSRAEGRKRWTELRLWRSPAGKLVAEQLGRSELAGERDRSMAWVCDATADVVRHLGHGWLARELYKAAGIDDSERVA